MANINLDNVNRKLVGIEYIRVNKIDSIEFVEIDEDGMEYVLVNKIDEIDDDKPVQIYGTVVVDSALYGDQIVYYRSRNNPEIKFQGEYLSLTGPSMPVWVEDPFIITVCLWFHDDDEIVKGEIEDEIVWDKKILHLYGNRRPYDQLIEEEMSGKYGTVSVGYSIITRALNATINVVMINDQGESPVAVYGAIEATTTFYNESSITRILFDKLENEYIEVSQQQSIPLTRPVFPVGVHSYLTIMVDLSLDDQLALGSVEFTPVMGTQKKNITGNYGELQVSFTCAY